MPKLWPPSSLIRRMAEATLFQAALFVLLQCTAETRLGLQCSREVVWYASRGPQPLHPRCWQHRIETDEPTLL